MITSYINFSKARPYLDQSYLDRQVHLLVKRVICHSVKIIKSGNYVRFNDLGSRLTIDNLGKFALKTLGAQDYIHPIESMICGLPIDSFVSNTESQILFKTSNATLRHVYISQAAMMAMTCITGLPCFVPLRDGLYKILYENPSTRITKLINQVGYALNEKFTRNFYTGNYVNVKWQKIIDQEWNKAQIIIPPNNYF
jgi:hypothetical protein